MKTNDRLEKLGTLPVTRRGFMKGATAVAAAATFTGCSSSDDDASSDTGGGSYSNNNSPNLREVEKVYGVCPIECLHHSLCCHVDKISGEVIRVEPTRLPNDHYYTTACGRGMARMQFFTENRPATPMKRVTQSDGKKRPGDGFVAISWDKALTEIADRLKDVYDNEKWGLIATGTGNMGPVYNTSFSRLLNFAFKKRASATGNVCCQAVSDGMDPTLGERGIDTRDTVGDASCVVAWGNSPADTSNAYWRFFGDALASGAKLISVDPRLSGTGEHAHQWVAPIPGTDVLFGIGVMREMFRKHVAGSSDRWINEDFLKHRTNAPFLVDLNGVTLTDPKLYNKMKDLKLKQVSGKYQVCTNASTPVYADAETNKGRSVATTQTPVLDYYNATDEVVTVYTLMKALYAYDIVALGLHADLVNFFDPMHADNKIVGTSGVSQLAIEGFADAWCTEDRKSMIFQNMPGGGRSENGAHMCAIHSYLAMLIGAFGDRGNGVNDTSGFTGAGGAEPDYATTAARPGTTVTWRKKDGSTASAAPTALASHSFPFGYMAQRIRDANAGNAQTAMAIGNTETHDPKISFIWIGSANLTSQKPNSGVMKEALLSTETVVVAKFQFDDDAKHADFYLPATPTFEDWDFQSGARNKYVNLAMGGKKPYGQSKSDPQIMRALGPYLVKRGIMSEEDYEQFDVDNIEITKGIIERVGNNYAANGIADFEDFKKKVSVRPKVIPAPWVPIGNHVFKGGLAMERRANFFVTAWNTGNRLRNINLTPNPAKDLYKGPFARYIPALESQLEPLLDFPLTTTNHQFWLDARSKYKLHSIQYKSLMSVHTVFTGLSWLREAFGQKPIVMIHPNDARFRGIYDGETVTVESSTGKVERIARVTPFIREGVTAMENGWWDSLGGSASTIEAELPSPEGFGHTLNSTLVEVRKGGLN